MEHTDILEGIMDKQGLANTLRDIAEICRLKEEHITDNWQDHILARQWGKASTKIEIVAGKIDL